MRLFHHKLCDITAGLVQLHQGRISAYSDGLGKGATFVVELPVVKVVTPSFHGLPFQGDAKIHQVELQQLQQQQDQCDDREVVFEVEKFTEIMHVLVVDDATLSRKMVCRLMSSIGCSFVEAADGSECLEVLEKARREGVPIDLVCMDFEMPSKFPDILTYVMIDCCLPFRLLLHYNNSEFIMASYLFPSL